jgi:hypothetical protein
LPSPGRNVHRIATQESLKTIKLYDRTLDQIALDEIEPVVVSSSD